MAKPKLNLKEIKQAVEKNSGYPFELEIVRRIEMQRGYPYFVEPNYSFEDHDTGKARELDFHAIQAIPISTRKAEYVFMVILGCCKDNKNPYVFFTRKAPLSGITLDSDAPIAGCPLELYVDEDTEAIEWHLGFHEFLHIGKADVVSSQFCELAPKGSAWHVQSETIFNDAFIPLLKALSREIERFNQDCNPKNSEENLPSYQIHYPLLVLKGPVLEYHLPPKGPARLRYAKHILVIRHYESKTVKCRYAIDVIHESYLEQYLDLIQMEVNTFANRVKRHKKEIVYSIEKLSELQKDGK
jgi:hypothetical protein